MPEKTYSKPDTFIGLWMNGTVCLLRSVRHVNIITVNLLLFYLFSYGITQLSYKLTLRRFYFLLSLLYFCLLYG